MTEEDYEDAMLELLKTLVTAAKKASVYNCSGAEEEAWRAIAEVAALIIEESGRS